MRRLLCASAAAAIVVAAAGCASQMCRYVEYYEPTEATALRREDGLTVGAVKSEAIKDGQPDWSPKSISVISFGK